MKKNEEYWLGLYEDKKIEIDFEKGLVYSYLSGKKYLLNRISDDGYIRLSAGPTRKERYHILAHRLIYICANGEIPERIEVNHKNGIKYDNKLINLELTTKSENAIHSRRVLKNKGGMLHGENVSLSKLRNFQVVEIRELYASGKYSHKKLADMYGIEKQAIRCIVRGVLWKSAGGPITPWTGRTDIVIKLDKEKVLNILQEFSIRKEPKLLFYKKWQKI